jgi:molybdopterin-guanine dinucleotide biosynthesis protein A
MAGQATAGVVLAGGRSRRMGGQVKALLPLAGKPLIQHVIERVQPQVGQLLLSVERPRAEFECFGLEQLPDPLPGSRGPLGGLVAALSRLDQACDWLLLVPCDAPFLPRRLAERLLDWACRAASPGALVRDATGIQPTFSIWHRSLLPRLERAYHEEAMSGFKAFLQIQPLAELDWPAAGDSPFLNINDPAALERAGRLLERMKEN